MVTVEQQNRLHLRKDNGMVKDVFQKHHMMELRGNVGIGHCRYPTAGSSSCAEAQPLYTNCPFGICVAHNGNLTNTEELLAQLQTGVGRHINTDSDSELLLNLFAEFLTKETKKRMNSSSNSSASASASLKGAMPDAIFAAMESVMRDCKGGYAGLYLINGFGLVGFRDPHGIRPLVFGCRKNGSAEAGDVIDDEGIPETPGAMETAERTLDYAIASESVAIDTLGFQLVRYVGFRKILSALPFAANLTNRPKLPIFFLFLFSHSLCSDVRAGEAIFIDMQGNCHSRIVAAAPKLSPCIFEYVYFARPDSIMDGVSVYESRLNMGSKLAEQILTKYPEHDIDVVIPVPDTSRTAALQAAYRLDRPFREGFIKNRYISRTFIMPGQTMRRKSVRLKLNTIKSEFFGKNVLLVDDSIVRGTTANEIVQMARDAGARKVFFSSAAPPIRFPNIYGIDIPTRHELIAYERDETEIAKKIGCDWVVYQDLNDLRDSIKECISQGEDDSLEQFDTSCFSGEYVTGESIGDSYFAKLHDLRNDSAKREREYGLDENGNKKKRPVQSNNGCESVSNDKRDTVSEGSAAACESLTNQPVGMVR